MRGIYLFKEINRSEWSNKLPLTTRNRALSLDKNMKWMKNNFKRVANSFRGCDLLVWIEKKKIKLIHSFNAASQLPLTTSSSSIYKNKIKFSITVLRKSWILCWKKRLQRPSWYYCWLSQSCAREKIDFTF